MEPEFILDPVTNEQIPNPKYVAPTDPPTPKPDTDRRDWKKEAQENAREAQALREKVREFNAKEEEAKKATMTETERLKADLDAANAKAADASRRAQEAVVKQAATQLGFKDPTDALAFIDRTKLSEDGANATDLLKGILATKPYLLGTTDGNKLPVTPNNSGNPGSGGADKVTDKETSDVAKRMFPAMSKLMFGDR